MMNYILRVLQCGWEASSRASVFRDGEDVKECMWVLAETHYRL